MPAAKLSDVKAKELRILRAVTGTSYRDLGVLYGVSQSSVGEIIHGFSYRDAGGPTEPVIRGRPRKPATHGTASCYSKGCRRDECVAANKARCADYRRRNPDYKRRKRDSGDPSPDEAVRRVHRDPGGDHLIPAG